MLNTIINVFKKKTIQQVREEKLREYQLNLIQAQSDAMLKHRVVEYYKDVINTLQTQISIHK